MPENKSTIELKQCVQWFAMRVTYGREVKLQNYLNEQNVKSFIPMQYKMLIKHGVKERKLVSAVHNLIFIYSSSAYLDILKKEVDNVTPMRYMIDKATKLPIVVPEREMNNFIAIAGTLDEQLIYLKDVNAAIKKGDRVQVVGGVFAGVEGEVLRIRQNRRVVVTIKGVVAVAATFMDSSFLKKI